MEHDTNETQTVEAGARNTGDRPRVIFCMPGSRLRTFTLFFFLLALCATVLTISGMSAGVMDVNIDGTPLHGAGGVVIAMGALVLAFLVMVVALVGTAVAVAITVALVLCILVAVLVAMVAPLLAPIIVLVVLIKWLGKKS